MDKNRTIVFAVIGALVLVGAIGYVVLETLGASASGFGIWFGGLIAALIAISGLSAIQLAQAAKLDVVAKNVNGNSSKLIDENALLRKMLVEAQLGTATVIETLDGADYYPPLMSEDTLGRIKSDVDELPRHAAV